MKNILMIIYLLLPAFAIASDEYDNGYCKDPVELL